MTPKWIGISIGSIAIIGTALGLWLWNRGPEAASLEPFLKELSITRQIDDSVIGQEITIQHEKGEYIEIVMTPSSSLPDMWRERKVEHPSGWPMMLRVYPVGSVPTDKNHGVRTYCFPFPGQTPRLGKWKSATPPGFHMYYTGANTYALQKGLGFRGTPTLTKKLAPGQTANWCFLCAPANQPPGQYLYEIVVHPTAYIVSSVRDDVGPEHVLQRGSMKVVAKSNGT